MPSDVRTQLVLTALSAATASFRAALATAAEQVQQYRAAHAPVDGRVARFEAELGAFAKGRIDVERLASLLAPGRTFDAQTLEVVDRALSTLTELVGRGDELFVVDVPPGGVLRDAVAHALEQIGRVFAASRVVGLSQRQPEWCDERVRFLEGFPFARWSKAQRLLAPPLIAEVDGGDLHAGGLAEFLDGGQKFVLVVRGPAPPAALVRLITPSVFVMQTADQTGLARFAAWKGPGVAALVPEGAALFVHDPTGGADLRARLSVTHIPDRAPAKALGALSVAQQAAELEQLRALAATIAETSPPPAGADAAMPAVSDQMIEKLASWLIRQADLG